MSVLVVVPAYNKARHIQRSLASVAAQTRRDIEVIVVDDGSTDGTGELARSFTDARFRVVSQANAGPGAARNRGVAEGYGDLIAFLDADDEGFPEYLERNLAELEAAGPAVQAVSCGYLDYPGGLDQTPVWRSLGVVEGVFRASPETPVELFVHTLAYMKPCTTIVRAELFRRLGGFYDRNRCLYAEDAWFWLQVLLNETVLVRFEPMVRIHREDSELSANLRGAHPAEPFLLEPESIARTCPLELQPLLRDFLAFRALKTSCVLGLWGDWRQANRLRRRYSTFRDFRMRYFWPALICCTPLGGLLGAAWRLFQVIVGVAARPQAPPK